MATSVNINKMLETNIPSTATDGNIIFSEQGNLYIYDKNGNKTKVSDIIPVSSLPTTGLKNKIYINTSDGYSLNYYDTTWHKFASGTGTGLTTEQETNLAKIPDIITGLTLKADSSSVPSNAVFNNHANNHGNPHLTKISGLNDVQLNTLLDGQSIVWDSTNSVFVNKSITAGDGKVKLTSTSTSSDYLNNLIDNVTLQISNNKLVSKSLDGLTVGIQELNYLSGLDQNIMDKLAKFLNGGISVYPNTFNTYADLLAFNFSTLTSGKTFIMYVASDTNHNNNGTTYLCTSTTNNTSNLPNYSGLSSASQRDFSINKLNLATEVVGILSKTNMDLTGIATNTDLANYMKISDYTGTGTNAINVAKTLSGMTSTVSQIDGSVANSHLHSNKTYLDKITEDTDGKPLYNGQSMGGGALTSVQETKVNSINITGDGIKAHYDDGTYKLVTNADANKINGILVDDTTRANGRILAYNSSINKYENAEITIAGIIGSSQLTNVGDMISIASGEEKKFIHPATTDENIMINVQEEIEGSTITDNHIDFSDSSKYSLQDSGKILVGNNKAQLDIYTKLLMHMDNSNFTDVCGHMVTNNGVTLDTTNKVFGNGSAYFNGTNSFLSIPVDSDFNNFSSKNFAIKMRVRKTNASEMSLLEQITQVSSNYNGMQIGITSTGAIKFSYYNNSTGIKISSNNILLDSLFHLIEVNKKDSNVYIIVDGILILTIPNVVIGNTSEQIIIGKDWNGTYNYFQGNLDEVVIIKDYTEYITNHTIATSVHATPYITANTPTYLKTTGISNLSLTTIDTILSLTIPVTIPTNTSIKCLFSVNNGVDWLYKDGTGIHKFIGDLNVDWTNSNSNVELQTYFTNLSMTQFNSDLSSLGIEAVSLDFAFQLNTTDLTVTPSISPITLTYTTAPHTELASFGSYDEQYVKFGVKRINSSTLGVKNLTNKDRKINVNVLLKN